MIEPTRSTPSWRRSGPGETVKGFETIRVRKDAMVVPVSVSVTVAPIRDEGGVIVGASGVHRDVTEQRQAFEAAQRLAAIVESSDDAIIGRTLEGIITSWNPAAEAMYGYSSEEIIGKSADLLIPEDRTDEMIAIFAKVRAGQHVDHLQTIRVRKDGTVFPVSVSVSPIRDAGGAIVGASVTGRDMTELEHAAQYARSLIEAGLDPLVTISPEGEITDVNEAAVAATGVPREELIGTEFFHYFTNPDKAKESYQQVPAQGSVSDYPLTLLHRDGTLTDVLRRLGLPRLRRIRARRVRRRTQRLNAAPASVAQRATAGGPGVTGCHRTGQGDHRPAPWGHDRSGLPAHTPARP
jgi:PAS domain S-box-containing protein